MSDFDAIVQQLKILRDSGLSATGIDENGNRLWKLEDVARHLGLSDADIQNSLERFEELHGEIQHINPATIQRLH